MVSIGVSAVPYVRVGRESTGSGLARCIGCRRAASASGGGWNRLPQSPVRPEPNSLWGHAMQRSACGLEILRGLGHVGCGVIWSSLRYWDGVANRRVDELLEFERRA